MIQGTDHGLKGLVQIIDALLKAGQGVLDLDYVLLVLIHICPLIECRLTKKPLHQTHYPLALRNLDGSLRRQGLLFLHRG